MDFVDGKTPPSTSRPFFYGELTGARVWVRDIFSIAIFTLRGNE